MSKDFLLTKMVATRGPASADAAIIEKLIVEGVRVFRINFSHGTFDEYEELLDNVRATSHKLDTPIGVLGDLAGPKIRVGGVTNGGVDLLVGQTVEFQKEEIVTQPPDRPTEAIVFSTNYPNFIQEVQVGEKVLLDDGYVKLICTDKSDSRLSCRVVDGGVITSNKGVNLPDTDLTVPALTEYDMTCVEFSMEKQFDFVAVSFVRTGGERGGGTDESVIVYRGGAWP